MSVVGSNADDITEPDVQSLYAKIKKLLLTHPSKPSWSPSYETINRLRLESETSWGVINQYHTLLGKGVISKCRSNLDDQAIITQLDYGRSLKHRLNEQYDESLLHIDHNENYTTANNKYVLQTLIHRLQHLDIDPFHENPCRTMQVTKSAGVSTADVHKFNDREYFGGLDNRRIVQIQVCFDKHVHGLQVKWLVDEGDSSTVGRHHNVHTGSQHFSSRFSGKNIDTLVLSHNEYICSVSGTYSQWIDSLVVRTNFGRIKSFGRQDEGEAFDLEIPEHCEVIGFCGSYGSQLYTIGALYRPIIKKESRVMVRHINQRIHKIRQISAKLQNLFADIDKRSNSDLGLLKYLRSNQQSLANRKRRARSYKTSNIRNTWIMEILKVLVKSTAKHDPTVVPQILNILAMILEDNTVNIFKHHDKKQHRKERKKREEHKESNSTDEEDCYDDLMDFMKSIAVDNDQLVIDSTNNNDDGTETSSDGFSRLAIPLRDGDSAHHHNQCVRVMIAVAIARGSLFDMLSIVKMLLRRKVTFNFPFFNCLFFIIIQHICKCFFALHFPVNS